MLGVIKKEKKGWYNLLVFCDLKWLLMSSKYVLVLDLIIKVLKIIILINYLCEDNFI